MTALALLVIIWTVQFMTPGGDDKKAVEVVCPVDGFKFTALEVVSTNKFGGLDYDFCTHAFKTTPLEYYVWVCPSCFFAGRKKDFDLKLSQEEKKTLSGGLKPAVPIRKDAKQPQIPGHVKYDLLAQVARVRKLPLAEAGKGYLHASWSCRQQGAIYFDDFDEWETLRTGYSLNLTPLELGKEKDGRARNRTDFELEVARRVEKDIEAKKYEKGANRLLARYLAVYLFRKHGENEAAERWLPELEGLKGENSIVDDAAAKARDSIALERAYQKKALETYIAAMDAGGLEKKAAAEIAYVIGELYRRTGDRASASSWYQTAVESADTEALRKLAADQKAKGEK